MSNDPSIDAGSDNALLALASVADRALVSTLKLTLTQRLSAAQEINHLATEFRGATADRFNSLAALLSSGTALPDALDLTPGVLPANARLAIRLASETGTLNQVYTALLDTCGQEPVVGRYGPGPPAAELSRTWFGLAFSWLIVFFMVNFIVPTLERMFDEFGMRSPPVTQLLFYLNLVIGWLVIVGPLVWLVAGLLHLWLAQELNPMWFKPWRWHQRFVSSPIAVLPLLAIVVGSGRPLSAALATMGRFHPVPKLRQRLAAAHARIEAGTPDWESLAQERLLTANESQSLAVASSGSVQAWLLRRFGDRRYDRQQLYRGWLTQTVALVSLLMLGAIVLWVSVGVFMFLFELITGLT